MNGLLQKWKRNSEFAVRPGLIILLLGLLAVIGCQAETTSPATTTPAVAARATSSPESLVASTEKVTATSEMSDEETLPETEVAPGSDGPAGDGRGNADVEFVRALQSAGDSWTFHVTVHHPDTGWEDYADGWDVVTPDGQVLKTGEDEPFTRLLLHPHENEQPFTRSQSGIVVPEGVTTVTVRAHDLVDGFGGRQVIVDLTVDGGPDFEVERQ